MKVLFESLHPEHITNNVVLWFEAKHTSFSKRETYCIEMLEDEEDASDHAPEEEVLLNQCIDSNLFENFHTIILGTYVIFNDDHFFIKNLKV